MEATRQAGKAASAAGHRLRQLRRWARRPLARNLLIAAVVALALLVFLSSLRHRPSQPFRTPEVAAALKRARDRTGPDPGPVVSLSAAPRLALVGPGLGDTKLALETRVPPPAPERPAEQAEAAVARPPAPPAEMRPAPTSGGGRAGRPAATSGTAARDRAGSTATTARQTRPP